MQRYFSPVTGGFYSSSFNSSHPEDAVTITQAEYEAAIAAQQNGLQIVAGANGKPIAVERELSPEQQRAALIGAARDALLASDMVAIRCLKAGVDFPGAWLAYVNALREIVNGTDAESTELPDAPEYPAGT